MYGWDIDIEDDGQAFVVKPQGEVDMFTAPALNAAFRSCSNEHKAIVCDLSKVTFLDSTGLRLLISFHREEPDRFAITDPSEPVERVLEITATTRLFRRTPGS